MRITHADLIPQVFSTGMGACQIMRQYNYIRIWFAPLTVTRGKMGQRKTRNVHHITRCSATHFKGKISGAFRSHLLICTVSILEHYRV